MAYIGNYYYTCRSTHIVDTVTKGKMKISLLLGVYVVDTIVSKIVVFIKLHEMQFPGIRR